jgi:hypothetical protein
MKPKLYSSNIITYNPICQEFSIAGIKSQGSGTPENINSLELRREEADLTYATRKINPTSQATWLNNPQDATWGLNEKRSRYFRGWEKSFFCLTYPNISLDFNRFKV